MEIVSVDTIALTGVEITSGGRTLKGDIDAALTGQSLTLRKMTLTADDTTLDVTGQLSDWSAPAGELTVKAGQLNLGRLLTFPQQISRRGGTHCCLPHPDRRSPRQRPRPRAWT